MQMIGFMSLGPPDNPVAHTAFGGARHYGRLDEQTVLLLSLRAAGSQSYQLVTDPNALAFFTSTDPSYGCIITRVSESIRRELEEFDVPIPRTSTPMHNIETLTTETDFIHKASFVR